MKTETISSTTKSKIEGFFIAFNGQKKECSLCHRTHARSFVVSNNNKLEFYGSGCIQKKGFDNLELSRVLSKITVQTSRLSYELLKGIEKGSEEK